MLINYPAGTKKRTDYVIPATVATICGQDSCPLNTEQGILNIEYRTTLEGTLA